MMESDQNVFNHKSRLQRFDDQQRALSIDAPDGWGPNIVQQGSETLNIKEEETGLEGEQLNETSVPLKSEDREEKPQISQIYLHQMRGRDLPISSSANEECWRGAETTWNPDVNTPEDGPNSPETEDSDEDAWDNDDDQQRALSIDAPDGWGPNMVQQGSETLNIKEEETSLEGEQPNGKEETDANMFSFSSVPLKSEDDEEETLISQIHQHQMEGGDLPVSRSADKVYCRGAETSCNPDVNTHEDDPSSPETEDSHEDSGDNDDDQQRALSIDAPDGWGPNMVQQGSETLNIKEEETSLEGEQPNGKEETDANMFSFSSVPLKSEDDEEETLISHINQHQMEGGDLPISRSADEDCRGAETSCNPDVNTHEDDPSSPETEDSHEDAGDNDALSADVLQMLVVKEEVPEDWRPNVNQQEPELLSIKEEKEEWWTSLEGQLGGIKKLDATRFSFNVVTLKSEDEKEERLISQVHWHQMEGRDLSVSSSAEQMEAEADEDDCGIAETTRGLNLNTEDTYSSSETEVSEDDVEVDDNSHMQLKLLSEPGSKTEDTIHTGPKSFCHDLCDESNQNMNLNTQVTIQEGQKVFVCDVCRQSFSQKSRLNRHIRIHTGQKPFGCDVCRRSFSQKSHLNRHMIIHTGQKPFCCDVCQQSFTRKTNLNIHMRIHTGQKPYSCDVCSRSFSQKKSLNMHMRIHTGQKPFCCDVCGQRFGNKICLNTHIIIHTGQKPYSCDVCRRSFSQKTSLNTHMRIHTGQKPYSCDVCERSFNQKTHLNRHMLVHTGQKPFCCDVCGQQFRNKAYINSHMRIHTGQKPYCCDVCGRNFSHKTSLKIHTRIHTGQKPFSCDVCGRSFSQKIHLNTHMRSHTGQKPFGCDVCGQRFTRKTSLNTHMRKHTGQKPFGCDVCGQRFTRKTSLNTHMRIHTGQKQFSCDVCGQRFNQKTLLTTHMRIHTKGETSRKLLGTSLASTSSFVKAQ
nr:zinc finger protein 250 isoform X3 [Nothobranchius furzeri]XP_054601100.1 zinc finger protein 250 isoform X3 [Nothobranchius furzeri]